MGNPHPQSPGPGNWDEAVKALPPPCDHRLVRVSAAGRLDCALCPAKGVHAHIHVEVTCGA